MSVSGAVRRAVSTSPVLESALGEPAGDGVERNQDRDLNQLATLLWLGSSLGLEGQATREGIPAQPEAATIKSTTTPRFRNGLMATPFAWGELDVPTAPAPNRP
jgi:hypothetical protein